VNVQLNDLISETKSPSLWNFILLSLQSLPPNHQNTEMKFKPDLLIQIYTLDRLLCWHCSQVDSRVFVKCDVNYDFCFV